MQGARIGLIGLKRAAVVILAAMLLLAVSEGQATAGTSRSSHAVTSTLIKSTVSGTLVKRPPGTLTPGTRVGTQSLLGPKVFLDSLHGVALAGVGQAEYPAATSDGGRTWRTSGPALHLDAAQAPLVVSQIGALSRSVYFAAGGGEVVDATPDGGKHWYSSLFEGGVLGVISTGSELLAIIAVPEAHGSASNALYVSKDGGRHWRFDGTR